MAKPKPVEVPPEPELRVYEVLRPLLDLSTNEVIPVGSFIEKLEDEAEIFINRGGLRLTRKKPKEGN